MLLQACGFPERCVDSALPAWTVGAKSGENVGIEMEFGGDLRHVGFRLAVPDRGVSEFCLPLGRAEIRQVIVEIGNRRGLVHGRWPFSC